MGLFRGRNRRTVGVLVCLALVAAIAVAVGLWARRAPEVSPLDDGLAAYGNGDWTAAEKKAREQIKRKEDDPTALRLLARSLYRQARDQPAAAIDQRLAENTASAEDYFLRGQAFVRLRQTDSAIQAWRRALKLDPNQVEARTALEATLVRLSRFADAAREAESLAALPGTEALGAFMLGEIHVRTANPGGAAESLARALEHPEQWANRSDPVAVGKLLARSLLELGQPQAARERLRRLTAGDSDPETCWLISRCDLQLSTITDPAIAGRARIYRDAHPMEPEPAPYVGAAQCARCHERNFQAQDRSRHARTYLGKREITHLPYLRQAVADPANPEVVHTFSTTEQGVFADTKVKDQVFHTIVDYAFGSGDRGLSLVGHDRDGTFFEYRLSHYAEPVGWDVTSGHPRELDIPAAVYQGLALSADEVRDCMNCHNTHPYAILSGQGPEAADRAIGCERCHGPGANHLLAVDQKHDDLAIARPSLESGAPIVGLCAQCHSPRKERVQLSPGSPESIRFQGATLAWSRCFTESGNRLDCVTCHDPHRDVEKSAHWYESRCLSCHSSADAPVETSTGRPDSAADRARTPCPVQPARDCLACHMPRRKTPVAHALFTDHFIRVHKASDLATEAPAQGAH
jgi:tetratricopeptide (TPR) repeat protein